MCLLKQKIAYIPKNKKNKIKTANVTGRYKEVEGSRMNVTPHSPNILSPSKLKYQNKNVPTNASIRIKK